MLKLHFAALLEGICAALESRIEALKLYIHYYIDIYFKDIILVLLLGAWKLSACKNTIYTVQYTHFSYKMYPKYTQLTRLFSLIIFFP